MNPDLISEVTQLLVSPLPCEDEYSCEYPYDQMKEMHSVLHNTPMPRLMAMIFMTIQKQIPTLGGQIAALLESGEHVMREKSVELDINSTCPTHEFPTALGVTLSSSQDSWASIQEALAGFESVADWSRDDIGVFIKSKCQDAESANNVKEMFEPMLSGVAEMKEGMHQMVWQMIEPMVGMGMDEESPFFDLVKGVEEHLELGIDTNEDTVLVYVRINWAELRDLVAFFRGLASRASGDDSKLHMLLDIKSMLGAKDLAKHMGEIQEFFLANATNPRTNVSFSLKSTFSQLFKRKMKQFFDPAQTDEQIQEKASTSWGQNQLVNRALKEFYSGLRKVKFSFQYGKEAVEYYKESIEKVSNKLKKSKTLELLPESGKIMNGVMQVVQMSGMQEVIEQSMEHMMAEIHMVVNLGAFHLAVDSKTTGLGEIYHLAKENAEQEALE